MIVLTIWIKMLKIFEFTKNHIRVIRKVEQKVPQLERGGRTGI